MITKELRTSGSFKQSNETEREFVLSKIQKADANEFHYPGLLSKLITEISDDYVAWYYGKKTPNENSLTQKFERFQALHSEFYRSKLAKRHTTPNNTLQDKKTLHPVK
jgi:hypothetical protein